ncbi:hypothetical protein [Sphingobacterium sp. E70]|nr:hypothetical protein [Sphingobacterium sp. E70]
MSDKTFLKLASGILTSWAIAAENTLINKRQLTNNLRDMAMILK